MSKAQILIVEDDDMVAQTIQSSLEYLEYGVASIVPYGEKAIEIVQESAPDLVLMDILLKGKMDGIEAAEIIQSHFGVPVIFLTAHADEEKIKRAKLTMPYGYILKPFKIRDLKVTIEMALYIAKADAKDKKTQELLEKAHDELELKVEERTAELSTMNMKLQQEIDERKKIEEALRESERRLRFFSSQLISVQEDERKRISLDLHDEMGQSLTAVGIILAQIEEALPSDIDPEIRDRLVDIQSIVSIASEQVSELSLALRPSLLDDIGLIPTLRWHLNKAGKMAKLEIKFETIEINERLDPEIETVLFRTSQEAINNIIKHAKAKNVIVRMEQKPASITLSIKDDGEGFDVNEVLTDSEKGKVGLIGMQERANILGGNLSVQSRKGHGTQILVEIPLHLRDV